MWGVVNRKHVACGLIPVWNKNAMHVLVELSVDVRPSNFLECSSIEDHKKTRLAWMGVDDR